MPLNRFLTSFAVVLTLALTTAPAALAASEFPPGYPTIHQRTPAQKAANAKAQDSTPVAATGENTPLNLDGDGPKAGPGTTGGGGIVRTIIGLAVVIGVIYGLSWVLKQVKSSREAKTAGTALETLATIALGPNRALHLIRSGHEIVLVGSAEQGVTPIRVYSVEEARGLGLIDEHDAPGDGGRALLQAEAFGEMSPGEIPAARHQLPAPTREHRPSGPDVNLSALLRRAQEWTVRG